MGVKIGDLLAQTHEAKFQAGDETVTLRVRVFPELLSTEQLGEYQKLPLLVLYGRLLPPLVASWDLVQADGTPLPVTAEAIEALPPEAAGLLGLAHNAALAGREAGKGPSGASSATSAPTAT